MPRSACPGVYCNANETDPWEIQKNNDCFIWSSLKEAILCFKRYVKPEFTLAGITVKQGKKALETREFA